MLHQLSSLSSPPFPSLPLHIHSFSNNSISLKGLHRAAPSAYIESGAIGFLENNAEDTILILDRCSRLVYSQPLRNSDANFKELRAAIFHAHHDPCGPCLLDSQVSDLNRLDSDLEATTLENQERVPVEVQSQQKMSGIARGYAANNVPNQTEGSTHDTDSNTGDIGPLDMDLPTNTPPGVPALVVGEEGRNLDENKDTIESESEKKPERKKNKNKRRKGRHEKRKKRKRIIEDKSETNMNEGLESTTQVVETSMALNDSYVVKCSCGSKNLSDVKVEVQPEDVAGTSREDTHYCVCVTPSTEPEHDSNPLGHTAKPPVESGPVDEGPRPSEQGDIVPGGDVVDEDENLIRDHEDEYAGLQPRREYDITPTTTPVTVSPPHSRIIWPLNKQERRRRKNRNRKQWNRKEDHRDIRFDIEEVISMVTEDQELPERPEGVDEDDQAFKGDNVAPELGRNLMASHQEMGSKANTQDEETIIEGDIIVDRPIMEDVTSLTGNEQYGVSVQDHNIDDVINDQLDKHQISIPDEEDEDHLYEEPTGEDDVWRTYERDESKHQHDKKKKHKEFPDKSTTSSKRARKEKESEYKAIEELEETLTLEKELEDIGGNNYEYDTNVGNDKDAWEGSEQIGSQEFALHYPTDERLDNSYDNESGEDSPMTARKLFATRKESTMSPTVHDSASSSDSEAPERHVVYKSEEHSRSRGGSDSDRATALHSKARPWANGKY